MSNVAFLWIFSRGMELGVIVLCLLLLRALLRRKVPRLFTYLLWAALPVNVGYNLIRFLLPKRDTFVSDYVRRTTTIFVSEKVAQILGWILCCGTALVVFGMVYTYIRFLQCLVGSIRLQKDIYLASRIRSPFTLGVFRPRIYLPTSLKEEYYEAVVLHERVHIARKDVWMKYLAVAFLGLFWFQPVLWFAYRMFINDMEEACDETVLHRKGKEYCAEYARTLVEVSYQAGQVRGVAIGYGNGEVKARVEQVMRYERAKTSVKVVAVVICCLFMVLSIPVSWQIPRLVRAEQQEGTRTESMAVQEKGMEHKTNYWEEAD